MKNMEEVKSLDIEPFREIELVKDTLDSMLIGMVNLHGLDLTATAILFALRDTLDGFIAQKKFDNTEEILKELKNLLKTVDIEAKFELKCCNGKIRKV